MSGILKETRQRHPFATKEEEVMVSLLRTVAVLSQPMEDFLKEHELTPRQYNVLRILRGAGEAGWSCKEIGERLLQREPDITRLLGRLEKRGLISRKLDPEDRRSVLTRITKRGLAQLESLQPELSRMAQYQFRTLEEDELEKLLATLDRIRDATAQGMSETNNGGD
jgi:DNA-binding MarR family transcriptional regulator